MAKARRTKTDFSSNPHQIKLSKAVQVLQVRYRKILSNAMWQKCPDEMKEERPAKDNAGTRDCPRGARRRGTLRESAAWRPRSRQRATSSPRGTRDRWSRA